MHLAGAIDCDDTETGSLIADKWFALDPQKSAQYLGEGMWLMDAADYDNSGRSELVFSIEGDNKAGYEIFYDDFKKHATFKITYH